MHNTRQAMWKHLKPRLVCYASAVAIAAAMFLLILAAMVCYIPAPLGASAMDKNVVLGLLSLGAVVFPLVALLNLAEWLVEYWEAPSEQEPAPASPKPEAWRQ